MLTICLQTPHQIPLSGPHGCDRGNAAGKEGSEPASLPDFDVIPSDLLSQPFCWLINLDVCRGSRLGHRAHWVLRAPLGQGEELTGKSIGGGVCFFINNSWCDERNLHSIKSFCSPDLEFHMLLCRPFWLPREFTAVKITAVYVPPQANTDQALKELYGNISEQETMYLDAVFIVMGDF
ncbi:uncharacterized protein LOC113651947 isoform X1 [Tachysurus ichikawai]